MLSLKSVRSWLLSTLLVAGSAQAVEVKFLVNAPLDSPKGRMAKVMEGVIERELPDYQVTLLDKLDSADNANRSLAALQSGQVQFLLPDSSTLQTLNPEFTVFSIPFMFRDGASLDQFSNSSDGKKLLTSLTSKSILGLGYMYGGLKQLLSETPIQDYSDLSKLTFPYSPDYPSLRTELPVKTAPIADGDIITALKAGKINAQEATYEDIYNNQFNLLYHNILESNHAVQTYVLAVNTGFWNGLPTSDHDVFMRAVEVALKFGNQLVAAGETNSREQIRLEGGAQRDKLTEQQRINWVKNLQPLWNSQASLIGQNLFDAAFDYSHKLHFYTENFPPYNFEDNGQLKGIAVDFLRALYKETKYNEMGLDIQLKTWSYGYQAAQNGPNIVLFSTTRTPSREHLFKWAGPITASQTVVFKLKKKNIQVSTVTDLNNYRVGVIRDDVGQVLARDQGVKPENFKVYSNADKLLEDLNSGYVDVWIYNLAVGRWFIKKLGYNNDDFEQIYQLNEGYHYFAFSPDVDDRVVANIQAAIDKVKNTRDSNGLSEFDKIVKQYQ